MVNEHIENFIDMWKALKYITSVTSLFPVLKKYEKSYAFKRFVHNLEFYLRKKKAKRKDKSLAVKRRIVNVRIVFRNKKNTQAHLTT